MSLALASAAGAVTPVRTFALPPAPLDRALNSFAIQAGVSIGRRPGLRCRQTEVGLHGSYGIASALAILLRDSGCGYVLIDPVTILLVAAPGSTAIPKSAASRPAPPAPLVVADEISVVGSREPAPIALSPYAVSRVSAETLDRLGLSDLNGAGPLVAGMTTTNLGAGRDKIFLRGLSDGVLTGRTQSTVGLYLDEVALTYNAPDPDLRLTDMESVEVLRGPQGALYGSGSIAGVIQLRTRKPELERFSAALSAEAGGTQNGGPGGAVDAVVNLPLVQDLLAVRLVAYADDAGGYIDDANSGRDNVNSTRRRGVRLTALARLGRGWSLTLSGVTQAINSADSQYDTAGLPLYERNVALAEPHDNDFGELSAVVEKVQGTIRLRSTTALIAHQIDSRYDASASLGLLAPGAVGPAAFEDNDHKRLLSQEFTAASTSSARLQWLAGASYLRDAEHARSLLHNDAALPLYLEDRSTLVRAYAVFGEATLSPTSRLHLTLGARLSSTETSVSGRITASDGARLINTARTDTRLAPKAVVSFDLNDETVLYAQGAEGYRGGGVNTSGLAGQVFAAPGRGPQPNLYYAGDELVNYEVGLKAGLWDGRLNLRAAAFFDRWSRLQTNQLLPSGLGYVANIGVAGNRGIEVEATARANEALELGANLTLNDPELSQPDPTFGGGRDIPLPGVSRVSAGASVLQRFALPFQLKGDAVFEAAYVGRSRVSVDASTNAAMGGYATARLSVGAAKDHWKVRLVLDNLADRAANTFAFGNPFSIRTQGQITPLRPRSLTLRLSAGF